jgi:GNAT superfamily N-acetyltransferase
MLDYYEKLKEQLALEYSCSPEDLEISDNVLTEAELHKGRRIYSKYKPFFQMVTLGKNAVITADSCLDSFLVKFLKLGNGYTLFDVPKLIKIESELNSYGYTLTEISRMYLPSSDVVIESDIDVKWFTNKEINRFYGDKRFPNAICPKRDPDRPDRIVVCGYDGKKIIGMAGCSEDAPGWMQIGIDVMPEYRSKGVGAYLVSLLKNRIIENGDVPFYGTSVGNIHSVNLALKCGFRPCWTEIGSKRLNKIMQY